MSARAEPAAPTAPGTPLASPGLLAILFWGASFVATKEALAGFTPLGLAAARFALGALGLVAIQMVRGAPLWPERALLGRATLCGLVLGAHIVAQAFLMESATALHSGWMVAFTPIAIALGAAWFLGEPSGPRAALGFAVASCGVALVVLSEGFDLTRAGWADLGMLATCVTWTAYTLLSRRAIGASGPLRFACCAMAVAALASGVLVPFTGALRPGLDAECWLAIAVLGLGASALAFSAWAATVARFGALRAGTLLYFQPFVTLALSLWLLDEPIGWTVLLGGPLVLVGVALVGSGRSRRSA